MRAEEAVAIRVQCSLLTTARLNSRDGPTGPQRIDSTAGPVVGPVMNPGSLPLEIRRFNHLMLYQFAAATSSEDDDKHPGEEARISHRDLVGIGFGSPRWY